MADERPDIGTILGRVKQEPLKPLPATPPSSPEDYAPKPKAADTPARVSDAELAQRLKAEIRQSVHWALLCLGEKEALDLAATEISRIVAGRDRWEDLLDACVLGREAHDDAA